MYLKSLEIHGFKSFPNRTVMTFEPGTTVVVGPNGSGKSNISDAMRWVLGEVSARNIRGTTMEDVIFGGTETRRQMGYAEVTVCFDNTDPEFRLDSPYDEISVTRRCFRNGNSEYLINQKPCLRKDIHQLFMNTGIGRDGYSIIGQGKVAEMISKKSDERRNIFEEAAGIAKYRARKHEAELKLDATNRNMETTHVQIAMYEERLIPLEKEAEKARRGEAIKEEKKAVDVALWLYDTQKIHEDVATARVTYETLRDDFAVLSETIDKLYEESARLEEARTAATYNAEGVLQNSHAVREQIHQLEMRSTAIAADIGHANTLITQSEARRLAFVAQLEAAERELAGYREKSAGIEKQIASLSDEKFSVLSEQQGILQRLKELDAEIAQTQKRIETLENETTDTRVRLDFMKKNRESDRDRSAALDAEIAKYEEEGKRLEEEAARCEKTAASFRDKIAEQDAVIHGAEEEQAKLTAKKNDLARRITETRVARDTRLSRAGDLQRMIDQLDGYSRSVKVVMNEYEAGNIRGAGEIYGPLSQLVSIDREYVTAIEMALGASVQNIVTDTSETAKAAIETLKRTEKGRATFLPVSAIRPYSETEEIRSAARLPGYVARADKLVSCDNRFRAIVEYLLLRTVVFDTLEHAVQAAKTLGHKVRLVTLDGQIMNVGGSMTGGSVKNEGAGILSRNGEVTRLREEAADLTEKIEILEADTQKLDHQMDELRTRVEDAAQTKVLLDTMSRSHLTALESAKAKMDGNENLLERLRADKDSLTGMDEISASEIAVAEKHLEELTTELSETKKYRVDTEEQHQQLQATRDAYLEKTQEYDIRLAELSRDMEANRSMTTAAESRRNMHMEDVHAQAEEVERQRAAITDLDRENGENMETAKRLDEELRRLTEERENLLNSSNELTKKINDITTYRKQKENEQISVNRAFIESQTRYEQLTSEQDKLSGRLYDEYGMSYEDALAADYPPVTPENVDQMRQTSISCYNRLRNIGGYSPTAITDYLEIKEKFDEVNDQYQDLLNSFKSLTDIIAKLEEEMATTFVKSFEQINENFGQVFRELFGGGSAALSLTDPENVLTSGIEIKAAPPGKKIGNLMLLSGGEQSFVAIALFFSILKLHPTPFCILDEVEAALDEVNVFRFGEYIKRFCGDTQFILITHRRGTMQIADRLYGVTMPERGVSKVIGVDIAEIDAKKNELTDTE